MGVKRAYISYLCIAPHQKKHRKSGWTLKEFDTAGGMSPSLPRFAGETSLHCDVFISVYGLPSALLC